MHKPKCKKCGSSQIYYRRFTNHYVCKTCGYQEIKEDKKW
jgi:predicted RNA-binding Zn-ribbon protein involved in translation (DUF1610 family)